MLTADLIDRPPAHIDALEIFKHVIFHVLKQDEIVEPHVRTAVEARRFLVEIVALTAVEHGIASADYANTALNSFRRKRHIGIHILVSEDILINTLGEGEVTVVKNNGNIGRKQYRTAYSPFVKSRSLASARNDNCSDFSVFRGVDRILYRF